MALKDSSDPEFIATSASVTQAYTQEMYSHIISLIPTPETMTTNHNSCAESYTGFLAGDPEKAKEFETYRSAANEGLSILLGVAKAVTVRDPKVPETLRLDALTARGTAPDTTLTQPTGFRAFFNPSGDIVSAFDKVKFARAYQVWGCDGDPNIESNWRLIVTSPNCKGVLLPGLDHAKNNWLKVRAIKGKGIAGPWSNIVNLPPH